MRRKDQRVTDRFDVGAVRADFPILQRDVRGKPLVYLDNAASAQKPDHVIQTIREVYACEYANVHRAMHYLSGIVTRKYEESREVVRKFLNAGDVREIVFTRNATEAINLVSYSYGVGNIGFGDEIIISGLEHHSNIVPWHFLRERYGAVLKWIPVSPEGDLSLAEFERLLGPRTRFVAVTHMSNVLGSIVPVGDIVARAHAHGVPVLVDGSQAAVHFPVDVQAIGADFYVMTGHKLYGPSGIGVLYGRHALLESLPPFNGGGEMIVDVTQEKVVYADLPERFEAGTPVIAQAIGLGAAIDYVTRYDRRDIMDHEASLLERARAGLSSIEGVRILGNPAHGGAILSFVIEGAHAHDIAMILDQEGIAVRSGTLCAQPLLAAYGYKAVCRVSFAMYNTLDEVERLVDCVGKARKFF